MEIVCLDLEGVLVPEIWEQVAAVTGIASLKATTRDIADYDTLMKMRLAELDRTGLRFVDIQNIITEMRPLPGADAFLRWLQQHFQVVILSDTFYEFAGPLMKHLGYPTLFCHHLHLNDAGKILGYQLRQPNHKRQSIAAFKTLYFRTIAAGDSYNDIAMLREADVGILVNAPQNVKAEYSQFETAEGFEELKAAVIRASNQQLNESL